MNQILLREISEQKKRMNDNKIIMEIVERARNKFFYRSADEIIIHEMLDYVKAQLVWKKQSSYKWLLAIMMEACERVGENFEMLFYDCNPENYSEAFDEIY